MNKKIIIAILVIILILCAFLIVRNINTQETSAGNDENQVENEINNETEENEIEENQVENNEVSNDVSSENITEQDNTQTNNSQNNIIGREEAAGNDEEVINYDEKATSLAKEKWGESDDSVYYGIDHKEGDNYIITVRDRTTTDEMATYIVNPKTGEISEE